MRSHIILSFLLCVLINRVYSHSWVSCTDYRIQNDAQVQVYSSNRCLGYGRSWGQCCEDTNNNFGLDRGYNYQPGGSNKLCRNPLNTGNNYNAAYSTNSPMAKYAPGQQICLAWAPKNHVSASCNNPNIPDNGMELYMSGPNPTSDATSLSTMTKIADWGKNPGANAFKAFQNCPQFCTNPDKATCTGCFYIPRNVQVGAVYSFVWTWEFNAVSDQYTTCWEALIVANPQGAAVTLPAGFTNIAGIDTPINSQANPTSAPIPTSRPTSRPTSASIATSRPTSASVRTSRPTSAPIRTSVQTPAPEETANSPPRESAASNVTPSPTDPLLQQQVEKSSGNGLSILHITILLMCLCMFGCC